MFDYRRIYGELNSSNGGAYSPSYGYGHDGCGRSTVTGYDRTVIINGIEYKVREARRENY